MDSYYDAIVKRVEECLQNEQYAQALTLLQEERSMPYIPREYEARFEAYYDVCQSALRERRKSGVRAKSAEEIEALLQGRVDEQLQAVEQLRSSNIRNHVDVVQKALRECPNRMVRSFLIEALIEQNVSEAFTLEQDGLTYTFVPCALPLPKESEGVQAGVLQLREWFENENPSFLAFCVETLLQEAYLRLPEDIDETEAPAAAQAVAGYVFEANGMPEAYAAFQKEKGLASRCGYELLLKKYEGSFG